MNLQKPLIWWVDIENSAGDKLGNGPIITGVSWQQNAPLDKAGQFTFVFPAADPKGQYVSHKRILRVWAMVAGAATELGGGIVDKKKLAISPAGIPVLEISGDSFLTELSYRSVGDLRLATVVDQNPENAIYHIPTAGTNTVLTNAIDGNPATGSTVTLLNGEYLYFRHPVEFNRVTMNLSATVNTNTATMGVQYFNGGGWVSVAGLTDGTLAGGKTMAQDGSFTWTAPTDQRMVNHNNEIGYWIRMTPSADLTAVQILEVTVPGLAEFSPDVDEIMSYAPAGWSINTTDFYDTTANGTYQQFAGESVLAALVATSVKSGEHFRLGTGRQLEWLQNDTNVSSELRAIQNLTQAKSLEENDDICFITNLEQVEDSMALITRIYPYGAGNSGARVTLADCTITPPAGYTLNTSENYIKHDDSETEYGRIEVYLSFKDIVALVNDAKSRESAANQLFNTALAYLAKHKEILRAYTIQVTKVNKPLKPGQTIRVVYYQEVDGYVVLNLDEELVVLETNSTIDVDGVRITDLLVANLVRYPANDLEILANQITATSNYEAHAQPVQNNIVLTDIQNPADGGWVVSNATGSKTLDVSLALDVNTANVLASLINSLKLKGDLAD